MPFITSNNSKHFRQLFFYKDKIFLGLDSIIFNLVLVMVATSLSQIILFLNTITLAIYLTILINYHKIGRHSLNNSVMVVQHLPISNKDILFISSLEIKAKLAEAVTAIYQGVMVIILVVPIQLLEMQWLKELWNKVLVRWIVEVVKKLLGIQLCHH